MAGFVKKCQSGPFKKSKRYWMVLNMEGGASLLFYTDLAATKLHKTVHLHNGLMVLPENTDQKAPWTKGGDPACRLLIAVQGIKAFYLETDLPADVGAWTRHLKAVKKGPAAIVSTPPHARTSE